MKIFIHLICSIFVFCPVIFSQDPYEEYILDELSTSLRFLYPLDEASGTTIEDLSVFGNDATHNGSEPNGKKVIVESNGLSASFNDLADEITGVNDDLEGVGSFTVSFWAKSNADLTNGGGWSCGGNARCLGLWRKGNGAAAEITYTPSVDIFRVEMVLFDAQAGQNSVVAAEFSSSEFDPTDLHYYTFVYDESADQALVYIDGVLEATEDSIVDFNQVAANWQIGQIQTGTPLDQSWLGRIDGFGVWYGRALTTTEIEELWLRGTEGETFRRGDVNQDGAIDIGDITVLSSYLNGSTSLSCLETGDLNNDNKITNQDLSNLTNFIFFGSPTPAFPYLQCNHPGDGLDKLTCLENSDCD